ncbi:putative ubiquitin carboxyl-terminal hydrolase 2 [Rosellinia necatrix]|uniref:ubiquitinyl hydrolase 1 n=1 Tax=Rosellinia necatrix TaxID=77044 RepID=A0A1S7UP04_ROSNE|nr:putative ubiquitin carboxyl-terminal hydrolase 2 [Rosellinia necatrix]
MIPGLPLPGAEAAPNLADIKDKAIRAFSATEGAHAYTSPLFLRRFLESQLSELPYGADSGCSSHTMLLLPSQTFEQPDKSFLSILCADCRYHFHVTTFKAHTRVFDDTGHPTHMLIPAHSDLHNHKYGAGEARFICAAEDCSYMINISVSPPKLTHEQIHMLRDDSRVFRNLQRAQAEDSQRYLDIPDNYGAGTALPTLAKYIEDRLAKPTGEVLKIKKRNKRFCVAFGKDFDDLLRSLGFEERVDEEDEECWYITEPEPLPIGSPCPIYTRRAHLQDTLEELRTFLASSTTTPAWSKLIDAFPGYLSRHNAGPVSIKLTKNLPAHDLELLGCLEEFPPHGFSWAAILLANLCPSRRDVFLDAGLRCIQERNEDASLNIIMYKSQFDQAPSIDPQVQAAFDFFDASFEDGKDPQRILDKYRTKVEKDTTDLFRGEASRHLEIISNHLGADLLGDIARGESLAIPAPSTGLTSRRMSISSASQLLNVDAAFTAEMIRDFASNVDERVDRAKVVEALEVLGNLKEQQDKHDEAQVLQETADFLRATGNIATGLPNPFPRPEESSTTDPTTPFTTPPGLKNIGNTCYLNSLLQYFYNVRPIREMVLDYSRIQLGLDDESVNNRRTGGNGTPVTLEEAIVARQFIEELNQLFLELQNTTGAAASPSQKLANTALSSAKEILTSQHQNQPPPLPARPSPVPPASPSKEIAMVNITVEPISEYHQIASSGSSQTLVNELDDTETDVDPKEQHSNTASISTSNVMELSPEDRALSDTVEHVEDIMMEEPALALEQKISQISHRLEQSDRSGTSQQDVEEIIGNILEHLMRAILPHGPMAGKPNLQADNITELFFTTIVNSTIKTTIEDTTVSPASPLDEDILNEEVVPERWITAFPHPDKEHKMKNNLYEALDRYFSYELLSDSSLARYTTIRALPPIVHICIQRSDASGVKNKNPVIIPEELYLDRYMEANAGSNLWNARRRVWAVKERINELESRIPNSVGDIFKPPGPHAWNAYAASHRQQEEYSKYRDPIDFTSDLWSDIPPRNKRTQETAHLSERTELEPSKRRPLSRDAETGNFNFANVLREAGQRADEVDSKELIDLRREHAGAFDSMKQHKYCLHAMICHGGGMNAGHYWVWVRDFQNQVWYKYNDSLVTKDSRESQQVIDELNNSGDPYYVAYVRDQMKDNLVEVPQRSQRVDYDTHMISHLEDELEVIDSIAIDTPAQPANSPVNTPAAEALMGDAPPLELHA